MNHETFFKIMKLSKHFIDRWLERVKTPVPDAEQIDDMVNDAVYLQRCRDFFTPRGIRVRVMGLYRAVTVLTPNMMDEEVA